MARDNDIYKETIKDFFINKVDMLNVISDKQEQYSHPIFVLTGQEKRNKDKRQKKDFLTSGRKSI